MRIFDEQVSERDNDRAEDPNSGHWAAVAYALGACMRMGISIGKAFELTVKGTANAKVRRAVVKAGQKVNEGVSIISAFEYHSPHSAHKEPFLSACTLGEATGTLDGTLLMLADSFGGACHFRHDVGRSILVHLFTLAILHDSSSYGVITEAMKLLIDVAAEQDRAKIQTLLRHCDSGCKLHEAMAKQLDVFDPFYLAIVEAGERKKNLHKAFELLARQ